MFKTILANLLAIAVLAALALLPRCRAEVLPMLRDRWSNLDVPESERDPCEPAV